MIKLKIDGSEYEVTEDMGFSRTRKQHVKSVLDNGLERLAVREPYQSHWQFSQPDIED